MKTSLKQLAIGLVCVLLWAAAIGLVVGPYYRRPWMVTLLTYYSYFIITLSVGFWIYFSSDMIRQHREGVRTAIKENRAGLIFSLLMTVVVFLSITPGMRIFSDHANILGVSRSMMLNKTVSVATEGYYYYSNFYPSVLSYEGRPYLLSFFIHVVHVLTGYRVENANVILFIFLFSIFAMLAVLCKRWLGRPWDFIVVLLVAAQPVVTHTATETGLEAAQAVFLLAALAGMGWYAARPSPATLIFFWSQCLMLAHSRYEGLIMAMFFVLSLIVTRRLRLRDIMAHPILISLTPLLLLPLYWQRVLTINFTMYNGEPVGSFVVFSADHFWRHLALFPKVFALYSSMPYAGAVNMAGAAGLLFLLWEVFFRRKDQAPWVRTAACAVTASVLFTLIFFFSHWGGKVNEPTAVRYFNFVMLIFSFGAMFFLYRVVGPKRAKIATLLSLSCFLVYHPIAMEDRFNNRIYGFKEYRMGMEFLKRQPDKNYLLICESPVPFAVHNIGTLSIAAANRDPEGKVFVWQRQRLFRDVFVFQRVFFSAGEPVGGTKLDPQFKMETLYEVKHFDGGYFRISKLLPAPPPPAKKAA